MLQECRLHRRESAGFAQALDRDDLVGPVDGRIRAHRELRGGEGGGGVAVTVQVGRLEGLPGDDPDVDALGHLDLGPVPLRAGEVDVLLPAAAIGGDPADVHPVTTGQYGAEFGVEAPRPRESTLALDKIKATGFSPTNWRAALALYVALR